MQTLDPICSVRESLTWKGRAVIDACAVRTKDARLTTPLFNTKRKTHLNNFQTPQYRVLESKYF